MPRGDKSKYSEKQQRQARHIEEGYEERGVPEEEAERRAWATVNKMTGGGKKSDSGRGQQVNKAPAKKGGPKGGAAAASRPSAARSASAKKAAQTRKRRAAAVNDEATLLYLVNQGTLTFHVGCSRMADLDRPGVVLFDLDPGQASFADAVAVAKALHAALQAEGRKAFVKTSGKTELHVLAPWQRQADYDEARAWALAMAQQVVEALEDQATVERAKAKRGQRVYIDIMQNAQGHHAVPPYVLRAVPGAPVSTPLRWPELTPHLDPRAYTLKTIVQRLARQRHDPMAGLLRGFVRAR